MSNTNNGGPAFPAEVWSSDGVPEHSEGMTLRDYFAAKAMPTIYAEALGGEDWRDDVAREAYRMADAMLKAREA
jgi:hypothetical protein